MSAEERRPLVETAPKLDPAKSSSSLHILRQRPDIAAHCAHFAARVVQDALAEASTAYWTRRAQIFEAARHRPGVDYAGTAALDELPRGGRRFAEIRFIEPGWLR